MGAPRLKSSVANWACDAEPGVMRKAGQVYGHWRLIKRELTGGLNRRHWLCECTACGFKRTIESGKLREYPPRCKACGAASKQRLKEAEIVQAEPTVKVRPVDLDEAPVLRHLVRCKACQSFQGFIGGRCIHCGRGTATVLPHAQGGLCG